MPRIRKRAREFVEYAAKYHSEVEWVHLDDPDAESVYAHDMMRGDRYNSGPTEYYDTPIWIIPNTNGRDVFGGSSTYDMSNHRAMLRDFPDGKGGLIVLKRNNVDALAIRLDKVSRELLDICESLLDYPVYDESDHSELEMELESENWDLYGRHDFKGELESRGYDVDDVEDGALDDAFYELVSRGDIEVEFEFDATIWRGMADDETSEFVAGKLGLKRDEVDV